MVELRIFRVAVDRSGAECAVSGNAAVRCLLLKNLTCLTHVGAWIRSFADHAELSVHGARWGCDR
jgi:hypothetical protein